MKMRASSCFVCGRQYELGEEYLQMEVETSKELDEKAAKTSFVEFDSNEEKTLLLPFSFRLSAWMRTSWVCLGCVKVLPVMWQQLFSCPSLDEYVPVEQLGSRTYKVQRRDS